MGSLDILLVDDSKVVRMVIARQLEKLGLKVDVACDGVEAVEKAKAKRYDLIFMDIMMPRMDGLEATRQIRHEEAKGEEAKGEEPKGQEAKEGEPQGQEAKEGEPKGQEAKEGEPKGQEAKEGEPKGQEAKEGEQERAAAKPNAMQATVIVGVTGYVNRADCIAAGMDDFMFKPVTIEQLKDTVRRWHPQWEPSINIPMRDARPDESALPRAGDLTNARINALKNKLGFGTTGSDGPN